VHSGGEAFVQASPLSFAVMLSSLLGQSFSSHGHQSF
jgi:hypothetical protein